MNNDFKQYADYSGKIMEAETIQKNGASPKSQMSRGNVLLNMINVPLGRLAADEDSAAQKIRGQLAKDMKEGKPMELASSGDVTGQTGEQTKLLTQPGKLAMSNEDSAAQKIREQVAKNIKEGKPIELASSGNVTGQTGEQTKLLTQPGKLADFQWYEREPDRLRDEIEDMKSVFPQFKLYKMDDGRYYWHGTLRPGVLPNGWA
ncbi:MAG: hypothetical protein LBS25_04195, partial [Candidatus Symbiothrix sp.]|nr:hypothetical protein [Candidatus Symbiothrix sp.]